jgi:hypothetical protein
MTAARPLPAPVRPEDHLGFACAAAKFSAVVARIFAEQSATRTRLMLDRARRQLAAKAADQAA